MACLTIIDVDYYSGAPAAFASIDIYEVRYFLWWRFEVWVASRTAGFDGKTSIDLTQGKTYHVRARASGKQRDVYSKIGYCPYYIGIWLPA